MYNPNTINKPIWPYVLNQDCELAQGLIGWWPCDPANSKAAFDLSGYGRHMPLVAGPGSGPGNQGGSALSVVAASSQYASYLAAVAPATTPPFSMSAFANPALLANQEVASIGDGASLKRYDMQLVSTGESRATVSDGSASGSATSVGTIAAGSWAQVGAMFSTTASRQAVLRGVLSAAETTSVAGSMVSCNSIAIGRRFYGGGAPIYFTGLIENVCLWNRALTPAEWFRLHDPKTRWELRYQVGKTRYFFGGAAAPPATAYAPYYYQEFVAGNGGM